MSLADRPSIRLPRAALAAAGQPAVPTPLSAAWFQAKVMVHRARRTWRDLVSGPRRLAPIETAGFPVILAESRSPLWSDPRLAERRHQLGKVHNLRRAVRALDRVRVPPGATFSFWAQIGRPSRRRGFVTGRMLQQGCLVPATGGGLCQLSNALYQAALASDCLIVERHAHSRRVPGSAAALGRDATVAWNYVDLRFRARAPLLVEATLTGDDLIIRFRGRDAGPAPAHEQPAAASAAPEVAATCGTCDRTTCFRHEGAPGDEPRGRTAFLLNECWPEFRDYVRRSRRADDVLAIPLDGARVRLARYRWDTGGFAKVATAPLAALTRAITMRRLKDQGPARRAAELRGAARLADRLSRVLGEDVTDMCAAQSLLPFLWRAGHLGGRRFSVLLTRPPMHLIHARLDAAAAANPERASLADFRAPDWIVAAERAALAQAERIVTPHAELADLFGDRAVRLAWQMPPVAPAHPHPATKCIAFPGPTVARKGAFELRAIARALDLEVMLLGSELEGPDFWDGVRVHRPPADAGPYGWLDGVAAVVQPAQFEERPRHLLAALAAGVPVIATAGCGLGPQPGLTIVPYGDADALAAAVGATLGEAIGKGGRI
jgi:hypothetical protein